KGFQIFYAADAEEATRIILKKETRPDLVLLDINMPNVDGRQFCRFLKQNQLFRGIKVVLCSGQERAAVEAAAAECGADGYILKDEFLGDWLTRQVGYAPVAVVGRSPGAVAAAGGHRKGPAQPSTSETELGVDVEHADELFVGARGVRLARGRLEALAVGHRDLAREVEDRGEGGGDRPPVGELDACAHRGGELVHVVERGIEGAGRDRARIVAHTHVALHGGREPTRDAGAHAEAVAPATGDVLDDAARIRRRGAVLLDGAAALLPEHALIAEHAPPRVLAEEPELPSLVGLPAEAEPPDVGERLGEHDVL